MEATIRRHQYTLYYSGMAVLVFCLWSSIKIAVKTIQTPVNYDDFGGTSTQQILFMVLSFMVVLLFSLFVSLIRFYIGLSAIREGNGKLVSGTYLIVTLIYLLLSIATSAINIWSVFHSSLDITEIDSVADSLSNTFIEITSNLTFVLIIRSSLIVRKLRRNAMDLDIQV